MVSNRLFVSLLIFWSGLWAGMAQDFSVDRYSVEIRISEAGYFEVEETYDITFFYHKHGIYRDILTDYDLKTKEGSLEKREIRISDIEVPGHMFEASGIFGQKIEGRARIKIGDPDKTVVGPMHYQIRYRVDNAFLYEEDFTHFYWNLKPPDWLAVFRDISFRVTLPEGTGLDREQVTLYSGPMGNTTPSGEFELQTGVGSVSGKSKTGFESDRGEAVTLLIRLPKGSIAENKPLWPFWTRYGWTLILGLISAVYYWLFQKYGKDPPAPAVITYFPPDDVDPAMAGFLINDREDTSDLISLLPHWGNQGLIEIEEIDNKGWFAKDDTLLRKIGEMPPGAPDYQKTIFNGLFDGGESEVAVSSLKNSFYTTMNSAKGKLKKAAQRYYDPKARRAFIWAGAGIVVLHLLLLPLFFYHWGAIALFAALGSCILLLILNRYMIRKNPGGIRLLSELKGFKAFIRTAETNRLKMLLKERPDYFESTMAYALAFGYLERWADKFDQLNVPPPSWYHTTAGHNSMQHFSRSFSSTMSQTSSTMVSSPSSSSSGGGGSSGGGFGGGGGGSW